MMLYFIKTWKYVLYIKKLELYNYYTKNFNIVLNKLLIFFFIVRNKFFILINIKHMLFVSEIFYVRTLFFT